MNYNILSVKKFYKIIIISALTYILVSMLQIESNDLAEGFIEILGGFSFNQNITSIYTLKWLIPKLAFLYIIIYYIEELRNDIFFVIRMKYKNRFIYFTLKTLFLITILWALIGYFSVIGVLYFKNFTFIKITLNMAKVMCFDILILLMLSLTQLSISIKFSKLSAVITNIIIIVLPVFTNNSDGLFTKICPTNYGMKIRLDYFNFSYAIAYPIIIILLLLVWIIRTLKKRDYALIKEG